MEYRVTSLLIVGLFLFLRQPENRLLRAAVYSESSNSEASTIPARENTALSWPFASKSDGLCYHRPPIHWRDRVLEIRVLI